MDNFFNILKKSLIVTVFVAFGLVATYIPQPHGENINVAEALTPVKEVGGVLKNSILSYALQAKELAQQTATAISTNWLVLNEKFKEGANKLAWGLAKSILQNMMVSMVEWINSGFKGRPMFVEDVRGFLLEAADEAFGEYIKDLGSLGSFICSPFQLDIKIALSLQYQQSRMEKGPKCTLTGVLSNIDGFMSDTKNGFSENGGWATWISITSQPEVYTPLGAFYTAEEQLGIKIRNAAGEEKNLLDFGKGFLSTKDCKDLPANEDGEVKQDCTVTTPGAIIQEALGFNLDSGRQSLVTADEFNEVVSALLGQVLSKTFSKASGLLGGIGG